MGWGQSSGCRADGSGFAPRLTCGTVRIDVQELQTDFPEVEDGRLDCYLADEVRGLEALLGVELTAHGRGHGAGLAGRDLHPDETGMDLVDV